MTDPYRTLGVALDASDEAIRAAYLTAVRACPPERDPARFASVRAAFESIGTARARLAHSLFDTALPGPADVLAAVMDPPQPPSIDVARLLGVLAGK